MHQPLLPYSPERDVYRLLGLPSTASTGEISAACRRLARTFHPDQNPSHRAHAEMQVVNAVRRVMSDPEARARYDRERWRFHAVEPRPAVERPRPVPVVSRPVAPAAAAVRSPLGRYARATLAGMRAAAAALLPARCRGCRGVIAGEDAYCAGCGTPLLTGA